MPIIVINVAKCSNLFEATCSKHLLVPLKNVKKTPSEEIKYYSAINETSIL